jgi:bacteriocin-like protein
MTHELSIDDLAHVSGGSDRWTQIQTVRITKDGPGGGTLTIVNATNQSGEPYSSATWTPNKPA